MKGFVTLLGAGPGDAELLTIKGMRRLKEADVVVYDRLINQGLFTYLKEDCRLIDVGKTPGQKTVHQNTIEDILIEQARAGYKVVRLKSGDPYVFGRGGEEAQSLKHADIPFEVIPGITSALAGLTYAGIPTTYRDVATSFHVFTGHLKDDNESLNWKAIAQLKGTLIFLMGMKNLATIVEQLISHGYSPKKPVAIIEWATHPNQRSIDGNLETIVKRVEENQLKAPSLIVIGDVVLFKKQLTSYEQLPLFGKNILIQESSTGKLSAYLRDMGANLITFPARTTYSPLTFDLPHLTQASGLLIADVESWRQFVSRLRDKHIDIRSLGHLKLVAIGHNTAKMLEEAGLLLTDKVAQSSDPRLVNILNQTKGKWYGIAPRHKVQDLEGLEGLTILETHEALFTKAINLNDFPSIDAICLPNSAAATAFVSLVRSLTSPSNWKELPMIVMGASTRYVLEKAGFSNIQVSQEMTLSSMCESCLVSVKK